MRRAIPILLVLLACAFFASDAEAQCSQCYTAAAQSGATKSINLGILVLLTPSLLLFGGVFFLASRRRDKRDESLD